MEHDRPPGPDDRNQSPQRDHDRNPWNTWGTGRLVLLTLAVFLFNAGAQGAAYGLTRNIFFSVGVGGVLVMLFAGTMSQSRGLSSAEVFHLDRPSPLAALLAVLAAAAAMIPAGLLTTISARIHPPSPEWVDFYNAHLPVGRLETGLAYGSVVVLGPLAEELIYRGLLYRIFRRHWGVMPSAVLSALIFGLAHGEPWYIFGLVALGVVFALVYEFSGSLTTAAVAHAVHNAVSMTVIIGEEGMSADVPDDPIPWIWLAVSLLALGVVLHRLRRLGDRDA